MRGCIPRALVAVSAIVATALALGAGASARAAPDEVTVVLHAVTPRGTGDDIGRLVLRESPWGVLVIPDLHDLQAGPHAAHVHENPDCGPSETNGKVVPGGAAGGHLDPNDTGRYAGPYANGALGDLPNLYVEADGTATIPVLAPRPTLEDLRGRSVMIHHGADRYGPRIAEGHGGHGHDEGASHGGGMHGGKRMYCGLIPE